MAGLGPASSNCTAEGFAEVCGLLIIVPPLSAAVQRETKIEVVTCTLVCLQPQTQKGLLQYEAIKATFYTNPRVSMGSSANKETEL